MQRPIAARVGGPWRRWGWATVKEDDIELLILCTTAFTLPTDARNRHPQRPRTCSQKNGMDLRCGPAKLHVEPVPGSSGRHYVFFLLIVVVDLVLRLRLRRHVLVSVLVIGLIKPGCRGRRCTRAPRPVPGRGVPLAAVLAGPALD